MSHFENTFRSATLSIYLQGARAAITRLVNKGYLEHEDGKEAEAIEILASRFEKHVMKHEINPLENLSMQETTPSKSKATGKGGGCQAQMHTSNGTTLCGKSVHFESKTGKYCKKHLAKERPKCRARTSKGDPCSKYRSEKSKVGLCNSHQKKYDEKGEASVTLQDEEYPPSEDEAEHEEKCESADALKSDEQETVPGALVPDDDDHKDEEYVDTQAAEELINELNGSADESDAQSDEEGNVRRPKGLRGA